MFMADYLAAITSTAKITFGFEWHEISIQFTFSPNVDQSIQFFTSLTHVPRRPCYTIYLVEHLPSFHHYQKELGHFWL